jgi:hypothetical protein
MNHYFLSLKCVRGLPPSRHFLLRSASMDSIDYYSSSTNGLSLAIYPSWTDRVSKNQLLEYWTVSCEEKERPMDSHSFHTLPPRPIKNSVVKVLMVNGWKHVVWNNMDQNEESPSPFQKYAKVKERAHFDISLWHLQQDEFIVIFSGWIFFYNNLSRFDENSKVKLISSRIELGRVTL